MTVIEYRQKHKKCKYCEHICYLSLPPFAIGDKDTYCKAKKKLVNDEIPRPFCKVYSVKRRVVNDR
jgi:hypothetical protein